jgi:uncharacterized membrane protein YkvA (DUF1232 family)
VSSRSNRRWAWVGAIACVLYLINPTAGYIELIPDNFPIVGNLDEAGATLLLVQCIRKIRSKDEPRA